MELCEYDGWGIWSGLSACKTAVDFLFQCLGVWAGILLLPLSGEQGAVFPTEYRFPGKLYRRGAYGTGGAFSDWETEWFRYALFGEEEMEYHYKRRRDLYVQDRAEPGRLSGMLCQCEKHPGAIFQHYHG